MSSDESVQQTPAGLVGERLKQARESKGLAVADVAKAQHLRVSVIQAIEAGDYEQIGSELFLKGYVRAYAAQVGLGQDSLIAQLDRELEPLRQKKVEAQQESPLITIEQRKRRKKRIARIAFVLLVLGLVSYGAYRLLLPGMVSQPDETPAVSGESEQVAVPGENSEAPAAESSAPIPTPETQSEPVEVPEAVTDLANGNDGSDEAAVEAPSDVLPETSPAVPESTVTEAQDETEAVTEEPQPAVVDEAPAVVSTVRLQATFVDDCWVSVTDAEGKKLVSSLRRAGGGFDVSGEPPLEVVIGAADAVGSLTFQGETVSLSDYRIVNNRVQFSLQ